VRQVLLVAVAQLREELFFSFAINDADSSFTRITINFAFSLFLGAPIYTRIAFRSTLASSRGV